MCGYYLDTINDRKKKLILQLQELLLTESVNFYKKRNIHWLSAPITTGVISSPMGLGSDSKPVKILLDNKETYLADSMQFLLEYGCRFFENGCWYIMPSFRGEKVDKRHLKQFFHSEAEIPGTLDDVMDLVDEYIKHLLVKAQELVGKQKHMDVLIKTKIPRISFDEVEKIIGKDKLTHTEYGRLLSSSDERKLIKHFGGAVWVMGYDSMTVPFYQKSIGNSARNADLLLGIGETVGCGERWAKGTEVLKTLKNHKIPPEEYEWYINMKNSFPLQTSGFGMGVERFLLFILGENDIRNMQVFRRFNDGKDIV